jgi:hypothetical protein
LAAIALFTGLSTPELDHVASNATVLHVGGTRLLSRFATTSPQFVVVIDGEVAVSQAGAPAQRVRAGGWFGQHALLCREALDDISAASVRASVLLVFTQREFASLLKLRSVRERLVAAPADATAAAAAIA